jgi:ubiquinol-cytochrome c reductase cytochrome b subunit
MKITKINPILRLVNEFLIDSPAPSNLNYLWNFGSLLGFNLVLMIVTGIA